MDRDLTTGFSKMEIMGDITKNSFNRLIVKEARSWRFPELTEGKEVEAVNIGNSHEMWL